MRILLNGLAALKPRTGVGHHVTQLVNELSRQPEVQLTVYPGQRLSNIIRQLNKPPAAPASGGRSTSSSNWKSKFKGLAKPLSRFHFSLFSQCWKFDLYHEPNFVPYPSRLPTVITIHDLSVLKYPQWHPKDRVKLHTQQLEDASRRASHIITVSEQIKREVCESWNIDSGNVTSIYNGIGESFFKRDATEVEAVRLKLNLPRQFFLCVGTIEPRKNLALLIRAFGQLPESLRAECPLVLAGPWGWNADAEKQAFAEVSQVRQLGYVDDVDLPGLYCAATALLYPSHYEGFGMPPTEMLACGGVVVASDIPVLREVAQSNAWYVHPEDSDGWKRVMERLFHGERPTSDGFDRSRFTWPSAAEQTLKVYRRVLGN